MHLNSVKGEEVRQAPAGHLVPRPQRVGAVFQPSGAGCSPRGCCFGQSFSIFREFFVSNFPSAAEPMSPQEQSCGPPGPATVCLHIWVCTKVSPFAHHLWVGEMFLTVPLSSLGHELLFHCRVTEGADVAHDGAGPFCPCAYVGLKAG